MPSEQKRNVGHDERKLNEERLPTHDDDNDDDDDDDDNTEIVLSQDDAVPAPIHSITSSIIPTLYNKDDIGRPHVANAITKRTAKSAGKRLSRGKKRASIRHGSYSPRGADQVRHGKVSSSRLIPRRVAYYQGIAWTKKATGSGGETNTVPTVQPQPITNDHNAMAAYDNRFDSIGKFAHLGNKGSSIERLRTPESSAKYGVDTSEQETSPTESASKQKHQRKQEEFNYWGRQRDQHRQQRKQLPEGQQRQTVPLSRPGEKTRSRGQQIILPHPGPGNKYSIVYVEKPRVNPRLRAYYESGDPSKQTTTTINPIHDIDDNNSLSDEHRQDAATEADQAQNVARATTKNRQEQVVKNGFTHPLQHQTTPKVDTTDRPARKSTDAFVPHEPVPIAKSTKVVLVAYMRGGSSLLGELFNTNPQAMYWFEPLDAVYSHLYGTGEGWLPADIAYDQTRVLR